MIKCPFCKTSHVDTFLCRHAKEAGITKDDLPQAYKETGEIAAPVEKEEQSVNTGPLNETAHKRAWRDRNREHYNEYMRQWKRDNWDKVKEAQREYMRRRRKKARQSES